MTPLEELKFITTAAKKLRFKTPATELAFITTATFLQSRSCAISDEEWHTNRRLNDSIAQAVKLALSNDWCLATEDDDSEG